ncbi:MAG: GFA family protein [Alphaproteobacteria bacterium]|jgi:hypothetical protein|nr:GFA family protein [Rhodospirillaceae bacterium]MBT6204074.1 GFA family protein [Rhodospirillaceae bacterium]MBT6512817.1 GFA family protein [Rhodospirillaceae bacterium]MBT7645699.1 GFA family protein [Rhodospirillaceae bacterium]MDG2479758.1 GFA family protein [Alphaproteobacteria bacterium]
MSDDTISVSGGCYCRKAWYEAAAVSTSMIECHCTQCRKQSGHRYATVAGTQDNVAIEGAENISWFRASGEAERGFCSHCGSHLFWRSLTDDKMVLLGGSIDDASGLRLTSHIFVEDKGSYYEIDDGLPQFKG